MEEDESRKVSQRARLQSPSPLKLGTHMSRGSVLNVCGKVPRSFPLPAKGISGCRQGRLCVGSSWLSPKCVCFYCVPWRECFLFLRVSGCPELCGETISTSRERVNVTVQSVCELTAAGRCAMLSVPRRSGATPNKSLARSQVRRITHMLYYPCV